MIYLDNIENRIMFTINTGYYLALLTSEKMKLIRSTKSKTTMDENGENVPQLEITEVVLVHFNIVNNDYRQDSFVSNKSFDQLLDISPQNFIILKIFNSEFSYIEVWFTDQNSKPLEINNRIYITLVTNKRVKHKKWRAI